MAPVVLVLAVAGCAGRGTAQPPPADCRQLAAVPGPEDFAVDPGPPRRLLVSSRDLRARPAPGEARTAGAIWAVPLDDSAVAAPSRPLPLAGRDACSFQPHGVDLVESAGRRLLYVINHHEPEDLAGDSGCALPRRAGAGGGAGSGNATSVEIYAVERRRLRFLQRLADPAVLANANDLVALPNGEVWATSPPSAPLPAVWEALVGPGGSTLVSFRCRSRQQAPCRGTWQIAAPADPPFRYANGIAHYRAGGNDRIVVASSSDRRLYDYRLDAGRCPVEPRVHRLDAGPDNLTWLGGNTPELIVAAHPDLRAFLQHSTSAAAPSPSRVLRVPLAGGAPRRIFDDPGGLVSGASTAACVDGDLVIGQVFGPGVLRCTVPPGACGGESPR